MARRPVQPIAPDLPYTRRELARGFALLWPYPKARRWAGRVARWQTALHVRGGIVAITPPRGWPVPRVPPPAAHVAPSQHTTVHVLMALASPHVRERIEAQLETERQARRLSLALLEMVRGRGVRGESPSASDYAVADRMIAADRTYWTALLDDVADQVRAWQATRRRCGSRLTDRGR